jgi:8-oxo-dGTP pyrophosphatase MutT (NUDIX family)
MISFDAADHRFNLRAAAVFIQENYVLLHRMESDVIWALPGGRVEPGENAASAVVREMMEELGEVVHCGELLYVVENFFEHKSKQNHEVGLYFRCTLSSNSSLWSTNRPHFGVEGCSRLEFRWFLLSDLQAVNFHPCFLRSALSSPKLVLEHVVHRG